MEVNLTARTKLFSDDAILNRHHSIQREAQSKWNVIGTALIEATNATQPEVKAVHLMSAQSNLNKVKGLFTVIISDLESRHKDVKSDLDKIHSKAAETIKEAETSAQARSRKTI